MTKNRKKIVIHTTSYTTDFLGVFFCAYNFTLKASFLKVLPSSKSPEICFLYCIQPQNHLSMKSLATQVSAYKPLSCSGVLGATTHCEAAERGGIKIIPHSTCQAAHAEFEELQSSKLLLYNVIYSKIWSHKNLTSFSCCCSF